MQAEQWIEYATTTVKCSDSESQKSVFKELNSWLKDRAYFVANRLTVADIIMFYNLYPLVAEFSFQEKELYINMTRWFSNVQQEQKVRQSLQNLIFLRTPVYDSIMVRAH
ncbi:eukaryotic translation elongation factor 1 epsilon-1 [Plakobranchus ocellatus]|uniref:Eukaryotic translation elongation factor 1 epsilon-1 n=1 Tax=Plakobranchus ocellatus TaxID=259542 RepID=A0AAV3YYI8_9GAST|nr:eukaryotic translation elongation factor 1 epsilon-1 [Plakobranchus ocellatus]